MSLHKSTKGHQQYAYNTTYVYITYTTTCVNIKKKEIKSYFDDYQTHCFSKFAFTVSVSSYVCLK